MNDLRQLRHFVALAEHGHFARAAAAVHLSQPALSRSIQALEASLGCNLVDRHSRGISLTAHGSLVLEQAVSQQEGACRDINFDPLILPAGIEPTADPILQARSAAYAESFKRRTAEGAPQPARGVQL